MTKPSPEYPRRQLAAFALPPFLRLVQSVILARIAGADGLGVVFAALLIPHVLPRMLDVGLPHAAGYFLRRDATLAPTALRAASISAVAGTALAFAVLFAATFVPFPDERVNVTLRGLVALLAIYVGAQLARDVSLTALVALERSARYATAAVLPVAIGPIGLIVVELLRTDPAPAELASVIVGAEIIGCVVAITGVIRHGGRARVSRAELRGMFTFGLRAFPHGIAKILAARADRLLFVSLLPPAAYAMYAMGLSFRDACLLPTNAYGLRLANRLTSGILRDPRSGWPLARRALLIVGAIAVAIVASFTLLAPPLVPALLGEEFRSAVRVMSVIVWSALFLALSSVFWIWLLAAGRPGRMSVATVTASVIAVVTVIPLGYWKGVEGASVGVVIGSIIGLAATATIARVTLRNGAG